MMDAEVGINLVVRRVFVGWAINIYFMQAI